MKYVKDVYKKGRLNKFNKVVLVTKSPRRIELMQNICKFTLKSSEIDERKIERESLEEYKNLDDFHKFALTCANITKAKLSNIDIAEDTLYISSDTIVINDGKILGKSTDYEDAYNMLNSYLGKIHQVITAVCLMEKDYIELFYTYSNVAFSNKSNRNITIIKDYINTKKVYDKAGAYGIQEINPSLIRYIEGDINTIIGFPVNEISTRIEEFL